jgi:hypothetical protein
LWLSAPAKTWPRSATRVRAEPAGAVRLDATCGKMTTASWIQRLTCDLRGEQIGLFPRRKAGRNRSPPSWSGSSTVGADSTTSSGSIATRLPTLCPVRSASAFVPGLVNVSEISYAGCLVPVNDGLRWRSGDSLAGDHGRVMLLGSRSKADRCWPPDLMPTSRGTSSDAITIPRAITEYGVSAKSRRGGRSGPRKVGHALR